jgi:hypothetical protein
VDEPDFSAVVSARLDPILAPRGFPYAARENGVSAPGEPAAYNPDPVIFHCDGVEAVNDVMARYRGWTGRLRGSYEQDPPAPNSRRSRPTQSLASDPV